jgi:hypothetical protein
VWKEKKKKKRNPNPDLCFDPYELQRSDSFSECRLCLDAGALRGCCGGYYCNKCFYKTEFCPGCDTSVKSLVSVTNDAADKTKNTYGFMEISALLRGFVAKIGVYLIVLGVPGGIVYGFLLAPPETVHGYTCTGFMPSCEIELCSNFLSHVQKGTKYYDSSGDCTNGKNGHCVCSLGCVYDNYLYTHTRGQLGLDYCESSLNTWSIVLQDHFDEGVWDPSQWSEVKNGAVSEICGGDSANASLVFQGEVVYRSATTIDLDVGYGATVEFRLRYGNEKGCVDCCQGQWRTFFCSFIFTFYSTLFELICSIVICLTFSSLLFSLHRSLQSWHGDAVAVQRGWSIRAFCYIRNSRLQE